MFNSLEIFETSIAAKKQNFEDFYNYSSEAIARIVLPHNTAKELKDVLIKQFTDKPNKKK